MPTREILETYSVSELKREISKTNIKGYSRLKKYEIVELMYENKEKFHHLHGRTKAETKNIREISKAIKKSGKSSVSSAEIKASKKKEAAWKRELWRRSMEKRKKKKG